MTRKRYVKLMMASGWDRNTANSIGVDPGECSVTPWNNKKLKLWAYRGCFPFTTYKEAWENDKMLVAMQRMHDGMLPLKVGYKKGEYE